MASLSPWASWFRASHCPLVYSHANICACSSQLLILILLPLSGRYLPCISLHALLHYPKKNKSHLIWCCSSSSARKAISSGWPVTSITSNLFPCTVLRIVVVMSGRVSIVLIAPLPWWIGFNTRSSWTFWTGTLGHVDVSQSLPWTRGI